MDPIKRPVKPGQWEIFARSLKVEPSWNELCNRWQIDVNGASRVWYFIDSTAYGVRQKKRTGRVIIDQVYFGHPKQTE